MTKPWDAARAASKRPLRKPYKPCGPVGESLGYIIQPGRMVHAGAGDYVFLCCGLHVCGCAQKREAKFPEVVELTRKTIAEHEFDTLICSPRDAGRLTAANLGVSIKPSPYARSGEWTLLKAAPRACKWCDEHDATRTKSCDHLFSVRNGYRAPADSPEHGAYTCSACFLRVASATDCRHAPDCPVRHQAAIGGMNSVARGEPELSACPPCPDCGHEHRFSGCTACRCDRWTKPDKTLVHKHCLAYGAAYCGKCNMGYSAKAPCSCRKELALKTVCGDLKVRVDPNVPPGALHIAHREGQFPAPPLPRTMAGRLATLEGLKEAGVGFDREAALKLLEGPPKSGTESALRMAAHQLQVGAMREEMQRTQERIGEYMREHMGMPLLESKPPGTETEGDNDDDED